MVFYNILYGQGREDKVLWPIFSLVEWMNIICIFFCFRKLLILASIFFVCAVLLLNSTVCHICIILGLRY